MLDPWGIGGFREWGGEKPNIKQIVERYGQKLELSDFFY